MVTRKMLHRYLFGCSMSGIPSQAAFIKKTYGRIKMRSSLVVKYIDKSRKEVLEIVQLRVLSLLTWNILILYLNCHLQMVSQIKRIKTRVWEVTNYFFVNSCTNCMNNSWRPFTDKDLDRSVDNSIDLVIIIRDGTKDKLPTYRASYKCLPSISWAWQFLVCQANDSYIPVELHLLSLLL